MDKIEYVELLKEKLNGLPLQDIERSIEFYSEMIDDKMEEGLTESEAILAMPSVDDVATQVIMNVPLTKLVMKTYIVSEEFKNIELDSKDANVSIKRSDDDICKVVCGENDKVYHDVEVKNGVLTIKRNHKEIWFFSIIGLSDLNKMEIYLPSDNYDSLMVNAKSGSVEILDNFVFENVEIDSQSGNITIEKIQSKNVTSTLKSGNIRLKDIKSINVHLQTKSGDVTIENAILDGDVSVSCDSGSVKMSDLKSDLLTISTKSGIINLSNVLIDNNMTLISQSGTVKLNACDSETLKITTSSGSVRGSLRSPKIFITKSKSGNISVPASITGGKCEIETRSGNIKIEIAS